MADTWTPERVDQLKSLRRSGVSYREIARRMQLRLGQVSGKLHRIAGYRPPPREPKAPYEPDQNCVLAAAIVADGGTYADAMKETGLDWNGVYKAVMASKSRERKERQRMESDHAR